MPGIPVDQPDYPNAGSVGHSAIGSLYDFIPHASIFVAPELVPEEPTDAWVRELLADYPGTGDCVLYSTDYSPAIKPGRDPALPDFPATPAMRGVARKLAEEHFAAQDLLTDTRLALGRHGEAIPALRQRTTEHPGHERAWAQLMLALYSSEMRARALTTFTEARSALLESSGIEPGPSMRRLHEQMLHDYPSRAVLTSHLRQDSLH
jgi:hypothetical protein